MGIKGEWVKSAQNIFHVRIEAPWTWEEYRSNVDKACAEMKALGTPTTIIVDVSEAKGFPRGDILGNLRYIERNIPENVVASIIVGSPYIITSFMNVFTKLRASSNQRVRLANTLDEAYTIAQQRLGQIAENTAK